MHEDTAHGPTHTGEIAALKALIVQLPDEARVEVRLHDGLVFSGVVTVRPALQVVRGAQGGQGFNALLRLDDMRDPEHAHWVWLDRVAEVRQLGPATDQDPGPA